MEQFEQAQNSVELVMHVEHAQTEAILILCWALTANLTSQRNKTPTKSCDNSPIKLGRSRIGFMGSHGLVGTARDELSLAKHCLVILKR